MSPDAPLPSHLRDRLRAHGPPGMPDSDILARVLDELERREYAEELRRELATPQASWVRHEDIEWD